MIAPGDPLQPVLDPGDVRQDLLLQLPHHPIGRGQEQLALAGEMAVDRPLADPEPLRQRLRDRVREAMLGEQLGRGLRISSFRARFVLVGAASLRLLLATLFS